MVYINQACCWEWGWGFPPAAFGGAVCDRIQHESRTGGRSMLIGGSLESSLFRRVDCLENVEGRSFCPKSLTSARR
jgi:hypothetical protein